MFIRQKKNKSGSVSVQIIAKDRGNYKVVKTIGSAQTDQQIATLVYLGKQELAKIQAQGGLFVLEDDALIESFLSQLQNSQIRTVGPELIFGKIYDAIGFHAIGEEMFRHLVISRLAFPLSKLKGISKNLIFYNLNPFPFSKREGEGVEFLEMPLFDIVRQKNQRLEFSNA